MNKIKLVAIGSAHFDVIAQASKNSMGLDKPGLVRIETGGTANNIAINWAKLGANPHLVTTIPDTALGSTLISHLERELVTVHNIGSDNSATEIGVFCAHLGSDGELTQAISHMPVENSTFSEDELDEVLSDARLVIADCNLSSEELANIAIQCLTHDAQFAIAGVSEQKCVRAASTRGMCSFISLNRAEGQFFCQNLLGTIPASAHECAQLISTYMQADVLLTLGADGAIWHTEGESTRVEVEKHLKSGNRLGSGDGFLAAFSLAISHGLPPRESLVRANRIAGIIGSKATANLGNAQALDHALEELEAKATKDPLTGLSNREGARVGMEKRKSKNSSLAVLILDIDFFKKINDTYGHEVGDQAIRAVANLFKKALRDVDIACRWGGEEFVGFLNGSSLEEAHAVAERVRASIEAASIIPGKVVTVSLGIALRKDSEPLEACLSRADQALYFSKQSGRNKVSTQLDLPPI